MTQRRYFTAFLLSSFYFALLVWGVLSFLDVEKRITPKKKESIKIALITPVATPVVAPSIVLPPKQPIVKKTPIKKPVVPPKPIVKKAPPKKIIKKRVIKKKRPKKHVKKIVHKKKKHVVKRVVHKKKIVHKKTVHKKRVIHKKKHVVKRKIVPKVIKPQPKKEKIEEIIYAPIVQIKPTPQPKPIPRPIIKPTRVAPPKPKPITNNAHAKRAFLQNVRAKIIANKKYPKLALRRHIESDVKVRFDITSSGGVSNIRCINGKRIFYKSIRRTLERSFPINIPNEMRASLPIHDVSVVLHFNIR